MSKLRICAVGGKYSGVTYHRLALPLSLMLKEYLIITDTISEQMLIDKQINIVVVNRFCELIPLTDLLKWKAKLSFKLIVDIDDFWNLFDQHLSSAIYRKLNIPQIVINYIKVADLVTTTHHRLRLEIIKYNKNCEVLPNALPFDKDQFTPQRKVNEFVNITHTGSITHYPDMRQLKNPINELAKSKSFRELTRMLLCGWNEANKFHWDQMGGWYTANEKLNYKIIESLPVDLYMNFYNEADILLTPLLDNKFNRLKSNLKALEAGAKRIPIMAMKRPPYDDIPTVCWVDNWERDIKRMTFSKQMQEDFGEANAEYVRKHYDIFKINEGRNVIYNKLIE